MSLHEKPMAQERSAKRQKRNEELSPDLSSLGDPLVILLSFLNHKDIIKLEATNRQFRDQCQAHWGRLEAKIPPEALSEMMRESSTSSPPSRSDYVSLSKVRVCRFNTLSEFAKRMEYQSRLHHSEGHVCNGCSEYPNLLSDCMKYATGDNYDWFIRIVHEGDDQNDDELLWEGFTATPSRNASVSSPFFDVLASKWPRLLSLLDEPVPSDDQYGQDKTGEFRDMSLYVTFVVQNRLVAFATPALATSTRTTPWTNPVNSPRTVSVSRYTNSVTIEFETRDVTPHRRNTRDMGVSGIVCSFTFSRHPNHRFRWNVLEVYAPFGYATERR